MNDLLHQRCHNHKDREAVAQCPECRRFFCRECITEHDDRVLCTRCLEMTLDTGRKSSALRTIFSAARVVFGVIVLWLAFYYLGQILLSIPMEFHEGTIWSDWMGK